jgi:hypothetical protein
MELGNDFAKRIKAAGRGADSDDKLWFLGHLKNLYQCCATGWRLADGTS